MQISASRMITTVLTATLIVVTSLTSHAQEAAEGVFSRNTIEIGFVVSDLDKAAKFYTEVVGMTEVRGFTAPAEISLREIEWSGRAMMRGGASAASVGSRSGTSVAL